MNASPGHPHHLPPLQTTGDGRLRRVGVELELIGPDIGTLSNLIAEFVGGTVDPLSDYEHRIEGGAYGPWRVELDFDLLKRRGRKGKAPGDVLAVLGAAAEDLVKAGAERIVPMEVVGPPLPMDRLGIMEELVGRLRRAGARGTRDGLAYAFGLQFNPELPATDARTVVNYLKGFLCLFDWLRRQARVDLTRRLTVFAAPFPGDYIRRVVDPAYQPDLAQLIDDYLAANPTRNRALDLLPLFMHLDAPRVRQVVNDPRIQPRPALHYRLPNCEVDRPGWGIFQAWDEWLQVEYLAADPAALDRLCRRYAAYLDRFLGGVLESWADEVEPWLRAPTDL